ncbi:hypothetical protein AVEN_30852-1 [Araneus ventricosus]|uniref:Uncharacterized protein n=1 Tax=Araneus ventricosus TaxID=182803 RepID=A0A4Y2QX26_ARAVE|nr:hypothetical protein AVEN_30852-1 [Araneus ventricosus]
MYLYLEFNPDGVGTTVWDEVAPGMYEGLARLGTGIRGQPSSSDSYATPTSRGWAEAAVGHRTNPQYSSLSHDHHSVKTRVLAGRVFTVILNSSFPLEISNNRN